MDDIFKSQMNEMVNLIPTCIVSSKKNYFRIILLNSEKKCIYMYRGRRRAAGAVVSKEEEAACRWFTSGTPVFSINKTDIFNFYFYTFNV
jgi:hypothetical protein